MVQLSRLQLRRYYERAFGAIVPQPDASEVDTFETYYALTRIGQPTLSAAAAAARSKRPDFIAAAGRLAADRESSDERSFGAATVFRRRKSLDLGAEVSRDVAFLLLDRIVSISGWDAVGAWSSLARVDCVASGAASVARIRVPKPLERLTSKSCSPELLDTLIAIFQARTLRVEHVAETTLTLSRIVGRNERLTDLFVAAPRITGVKALANRPLERLWLENVAVDTPLRDVVGSLAALTELTVLTETPFGPALVERASSLRRLRVPAFDAYRAEWIDYAAGHPGVACEFHPVKESAFRGKVASEEVHRGVVILRVGAKKTPTFEIADNIAGDVLGRDDIDNHALRDVLEREARASRRRLEVSSEGDNLVVRGGRLEDLKWAIDQVLAAFGRQ